MRLVMPVLAAAIGALLISASHPALAQKRHGPLPHKPSAPQGKQDEPAQGRAVPGETEEQRQPEALKPEMQQDRPPDLPNDLQWSAIKEEGLGTSVELPRAVFSVDDGHAYKDVGRRYKTPDGRAKVSVWTQQNAKHETPAGYLRRTFNIPKGTQDYERKAPQFAAVSGVSGNKVYYVRCNLSRRTGTFHCIDLAYPVAEKKAWDGVVTRMSRSLAETPAKHAEIPPAP